MTFSKLSAKQKQVFRWCYQPDSYALICDGSVRSGKTASMACSFILWAMSRFKNARFAVCGNTVQSAERNIIMELEQMVDITHYFKLRYLGSKHILTITGNGTENRFHVFGGKAYRIYTDYRDWLRFYDMQEDDSISRRDKLLLMLEWYMDKPPASCLEEALEALIGFATRSEEQPQQRQSDSERKATDRVLSWQYDAAYVYAAFLSVYHMDLQQVEQMHWHLFLGLFDALPDETPIKQRMGYRSVNLASVKDKNERLRIRKIQERIRIPQPELDGYQCGAFFG